jgi:hypothetical protein
MGTKQATIKKSGKAMCPYFPGPTGYLWVPGTKATRAIDPNDVMDTWPGRPLGSALRNTPSCEHFLDFMHDSADQEVRKRGNHAGVICSFVDMLQTAYIHWLDDSGIEPEDEYGRLYWCAHKDLEDGVRQDRWERVCVG